MEVRVQFDSASFAVSEELRTHRLQNIESMKRPWQDVAVWPRILLPGSVFGDAKSSELPLCQVRLGASLIGLHPVSEGRVSKMEPSVVLRAAVSSAIGPPITRLCEARGPDVVGDLRERELFRSGIHRRNVRRVHKPSSASSKAQGVRTTRPAS